MGITGIRWLSKSDDDEPSPDTHNLHHTSNLPPELADHPLWQAGKTVSTMTADWPHYPTLSHGGNQALENRLKQSGLKYEPADGSYGQPEKSFLIHGATREQIFRLGHEFGQEAVIHSQDGNHEFLYTHGPRSGKFHTGVPLIVFHPHESPGDYFTHLAGRGYLRLHFRFSKLHDSPVIYTIPHADPANAFRERVAYALEALKKALDMAPHKGTPHPHSYPWHEGHTGYHFRSGAQGVLLTDEEIEKLTRLMKVEKLGPNTTPTPSAPVSLPGDHATNDQSTGKGAPLYHRYAQPYGKVDPQNASHLKFYPMNGHGAAVDKLVKDHGFTVHYAGGKHGKADLHDKNYNTKHLMIWDPSPESGSSFGEYEYTDAWRKTHELAHALTYPDLNKVYGEGRRIGALGKQRTTREALRSVHWEWLAAHKQRELGAQLGIHISDDNFHRELNTVMHDAVHRAVTGKFTEPSDEGFVPHSHKVPLETALALVREAAQERGLSDDHALNRALAKALLDGVYGFLKQR